MRCTAAAEVMALDETGKAASFARPDNVHQFIRIEDVHHDLIAGIPGFVTLHGNFSSESSRPDICFLEMTGHRFIHALRLDELDEPELHGVVPVGLLRLLLNDDARTGLNHRHGNNCSVVLEKLRHTDLFSQQSVNHFACSRPNALISTSTPAGRSSFISASTVCGVGSRMSSSRLWVRISNCSRDFLSTCGERRTVNLLMIVGRGIGPATRAPVRLAVSTISVADWSSILESYAFNRIRIFSFSIF